MTHKVGDQVFVAHTDKPDACPMPAIVACVNEDTTVNVMAINHIGQPQSLCNLDLDKKPGRYHLHKAEHKHEEKHEHKSDGIPYFEKPKHEPVKKEADHPHRGRPPKHK